MGPIDEAFSALRHTGVPAAGGPLGDGLAARGIAFAAVGGRLQARWADAVRELEGCIRPVDGEAPILTEGGPYPGCWVESTGTVSLEVLDRFAPQVGTSTHLAMARQQRADGLMPYKITADGPGYSQIQLVTPLARSVWEHYLIIGRDRTYLTQMYRAMKGFDSWLRAHRDTRGTGGVEAFCTFDTGHDLSPRFWGAPDRCFGGDAARCDPDHPTLPFVAPDLTANVVAQRQALALIAEELGEDPAPWREGARAALDALWSHCWDGERAMFYDLDAHGRHVRVDSDVLLRVLACGVGDDDSFAQALERHLMNTRRFLSAAGFTSVAFDDPRFDRDYHRNSWGGPINALTQIRAPRAFEAHGRVAELAIATTPLLAAVAAVDRFAQCLDPWSGQPGYTEGYSPMILWFLDALERTCGILPRPDGALWFSGLTPTRLERGTAARAIAWSRTVDGRRFELAGDDTRVEVWREGRPWLAFPRGWRVIADRTGTPRHVVGLGARPVTGELVSPQGRVPLRLGPNDRVEVNERSLGDVRHIGFIPPRS